MQRLWKNIFSNSLLLLIARIISKIATVVVMIYIARTLGVESFGVLSGILAVTAFTGLISDFGLVLPTIRAISAGDKSENQIVADALPARIFWSIAGLLTIPVIGVSIGLSLPLILIFALGSTMEVLATGLIRSFEGCQEMKTVTLFTIVERLSYFVFVMVGLLLFGTIASIALLSTASYFLMLMFAIIVFQKRFGSLHWTFSYRKLKLYTVVGFPFFVTTVFSAIYYRTDILMLTIFRSPSEVGIYNAGLRIIEAQMFIPMTIMATVFPTLARLHAKKEDTLVKMFHRSMVLFIILGGIVAVVIFYGAPLLVEYLYGSSFGQAVPLLKILSLMILFYFINFLLSQALIAFHKEILFTIVMVISAAASVVCNRFVIPVHGYLGAAWVRVAIEILAFMFFYYHLRHELHQRISDPAMEHSGVTEDTASRKLKP